MEAQMGSDTLPWVQTPCSESRSLSDAAGCKIYTKLENLQPSRSFKSRGIGNFIYQAVQRARENGGAEPINFYSCSAGNAGLAAATAARSMGQRAIVGVPTTTSSIMARIIEDAGARVIVYGSSLTETDVIVRQMAKEDPVGVYVSPYNHADIWAGNSTIIDELHTQLCGDAPDAIICSVGGGGLLNGVLLGLARYGWDKTHVLAMETAGADCLNLSLQVGENTAIPAVTSIAKSLGVCKVSDKTWELITERNERAAEHDAASDLGRVSSHVLEDSEAAMACVAFAKAEGVVVEPACGVSIAGAYNGLFEAALPRFGSHSRIVIVVCGGSTTGAGDLVEYERIYGGSVPWADARQQALAGDADEGLCGFDVGNELAMPLLTLVKSS